MGAERAGGRAVFVCRCALTRPGASSRGGLILQLVLFVFVNAVAIGGAGC